jgi:hypothetical protein
MTLVDLMTLAQSDRCYRCGYDLRGVADDQPCTECGLLAARSRRPSDELRHTRPGWLRKLSAGIVLLLLALAAAVVGPLVASAVMDRVYSGAWGWFGGTPAAVFHMAMLAADVAALLGVLAVVLLTTPEGYPPADHADRRRRWALRVMSLVPLAAVALWHATIEQAYGRAPPWFARTLSVEDWRWVCLSLATLGCSPLPLLLCLQLRSLARRARSAHLAEHCAIVGVGNSLTLIYVPILVLLIANAERWGFGMNWNGRSEIALLLTATLCTAAVLFALWNAYLLVRFAVAFGVVARQLRRQWVRDDRALRA